MGSEGKANNGVMEENKKKEKEGEEEEKLVVVVKVDMHCEACTKKVVKTVKRVQGVEEIAVDKKSSTIGVKGNIPDPIQLCHLIQAKTGRPALLLSPLPTPSAAPAQPPNNDKPQPNKENDQPPPVVTVVLQVQMHCEACAQLLRKRIRKVKGVESVETNVGNGQVRVKGVIGDPEELAKYVHKKTRKQVSIIKEDDKKDQNQETNNNKAQQENTKDNNNNIDDGKEVVAVKEGDSDNIVTAADLNRYEYYWPNHIPPRPYNYNYNYMAAEHHHNQPQFFSDENPNACFIM